MRRYRPGATIAFLVLVSLLAVTACANSANSPSSRGALTVQISDHREAIGDFKRLDITVKRVGLHPASAPRTAGWLDFEPDLAAVDLTQVVGDPAVTILQTTVPSAVYDAVRLDVTGGEGVLKVGHTAIVPGFADTTRTVLTLRGGDAITLVLDVVVESKEDHPGGGYEMHLQSATIKRE